jgi:hypothetical protein
MICFRDMTFCSAPCANGECHRHFGADDRAAAETWWGGSGAPISYADFSAGCESFQQDYGPASPVPSERPGNMGAGREG